jgi:phosphoesterase RecJ-like protein
MSHCRCCQAPDRPAPAPRPAEIDRRLRDCRAMLVVTHARSDGDALGSMLALALGARAAGKHAAMLVPDPVPARYAFLVRDQAVASAAQLDMLADAADLIVVVDTSSYAQLDAAADGLRKRREKVIVIDHHATSDNVGAAAWQDVSAAAAGVMVGEVLGALNWPLEPQAALALAAAITSDTGWLRFSNADGRAMRMMAGLVDAGVRPDELYRLLYQTDRPQRLALTARAVAGMRLYADDQLAVMTITPQDFAATGALPEETENLVNEPMRLGSVEAVVLLTQQAGVVRVSLRSRSVLDVAALAAGFGGGGHARAAGFRSGEPLETIRQKIVDACLAAMAG